jgi:hypothetical protein
MSSRLAVDGRGRKIVIVTSSTDGLPVGYVFAVLDWGQFFTPPGRPPTARERAGAREPYNAPKPMSSSMEDVPDEVLDDAEAIRQAMLEQRRQPVDLLSAA